MSTQILIFPAGMPRSLSFLERALSEGLSVVGSSSLAHDPARTRYPQWAHLPFVTTPEFDESLQKVIADLKIDGIYTPNFVVWNYLQSALPRIAPGVKLVNSSPVDAEVAPYHSALNFGRSVVERPLGVTAAGTVRSSATALEIAAMFRHSESIPGMCDHEKIRALCEIFRSAPQGDIVEIGSWWGKSAFVLARLSQCYAIGKLLCVDPWSNEHLIQKDEKGLVDQVSVSADEALTVFQLNLLPYANAMVNFLRLPSVDGAAEYRRSRVVISDAFGETRFAGRIAVLHVDGNHTYESAKADVDAWADLVIPGGWIIVDDYIWPYGNGPQRVGDEFVRNRQAEIACAFVMGSALFVQLAP